MAELDQARIASAALAVIDERGVEGFTMRNVAAALGVTPMALYYHVADKAELTALVLEAAVRERPLPQPTGDWQEDLWQMARWLRDSARAHPELSKLHARPVWTSSMLRVAERWTAIWQQSGLDLEQAISAASISSIAIYGYVNLETRTRQVEWPDDEMLALLPNARLLYRSHNDPEVAFELVVRSVITGLHAQLARDRADADRPLSAARRS